MLAWTFAARTPEQVASLLRALGRHRYVREIDHRIHWAIDAALAQYPRFLPHAIGHRERVAKEPNLDLLSRDPSLWRPASIDDVVAALMAFWDPGFQGIVARASLHSVLEAAGFEFPEHEPFDSDPDDPPHPELIELNWVLYPVDELDAELHRGALEAMAAAGEEVDVSAPVYQEGPCLSAVELLHGCEGGELVGDFYVWSEEPVSYADYVFRGASKAAKLPEEPEQG